MIDARPGRFAIAHCYGISVESHDFYVFVVRKNNQLFSIRRDFKDASSLFRDCSKKTQSIFLSGEA